MQSMPTTLGRPEAVTRSARANTLWRDLEELVSESPRPIVRRRSSARPPRGAEAPIETARSTPPIATRYELNSRYFRRPVYRLRPVHSGTPMPPIRPHLAGWIGAGIKMTVAASTTAHKTSRPHAAAANHSRSGKACHHLRESDGQFASHQTKF